MHCKIVNTFSKARNHCKVIHLSRVNGHINFHYLVIYTAEDFCFHDCVLFSKEISIQNVIIATCSFIMSQTVPMWKLSSSLHRHQLQHSVEVLYM